MRVTWAGGEVNDLLTDIYSHLTAMHRLHVFTHKWSRQPRAVANCRAASQCRRDWFSFECTAHRANWFCDATFYLQKAKKFLHVSRPLIVRLPFMFLYLHKLRNFDSRRGLLSCVCLPTNKHGGCWMSTNYYCIGRLCANNWMPASFIRKPFHQNAPTTKNRCCFH